MRICFFNLKECQRGRAANGVVRVASVIAAALRARGISVDFYPPPRSDNPLKKSGESEHSHFCRFLREREIDVAVWQMGSCRVPFSLKNMPCPLIAVWHNAPDYRMETYLERLTEKYRIRSAFLRRFLRTGFAKFLIRKSYEFYRNCAFFYACRCCTKFVLLSEKFFPAFPPVRKYPEKVCAIPNPATYLPQYDFDFSEKKRELLFVGRLELGQKRVDLLLKIWAKLEARFPEWCLRIIGDGPDATATKNLSKELGLRRVYFEGFCDPRPFYRSASIFCMTSAFEGWGMVLVEAAAFGCVPVAFDSYASVSDIISSGEDGILVPAFDCEKYAEELARLMFDSVLREKFARAARARVSEFSPAKIAEQWEKLFYEVLP